MTSPMISYSVLFSKNSKPYHRNDGEIIQRNQYFALPGLMNSVFTICSYSIHILFTVPDPLAKTFSG